MTDADVSARPAWSRPTLTDLGPLDEAENGANTGSDGAGPTTS